jgi:hypothetical protein
VIFDIIAGTGDTTGGIGSWTPAELFLNGEQGAWYDASDCTTMFQDSAVTQPVTALGQSLGTWLNKIPSQPSQYNFGQAIGTSRPTTVSNGGKLAVRFDGSDDQVNGIALGVNYTAITMAVGQKKSANQTANMFNVQAGVADLQNQSSGKVFASILGRFVTTVDILSLSTANTIVAYGSPVVAATLRINGIATAGSATASSTSSIIVSVPGTAGNACDISQMVFINRVITVEEVQLLETFIASKQ